MNFDRQISDMPDAQDAQLAPQKIVHTLVGIMEKDSIQISYKWFEGLSGIDGVQVAVGLFEGAAYSLL